MCPTGRPSTRASASRAASQPASYQQPEAPPFADPRAPQDEAPLSMSMFLQTLATQVQSMATQVQSMSTAAQAMSTRIDSLANAFDPIQQETSELRRLVMTRQEAPTAVIGPSAHFSKPAGFSGDKLSTFRSWWAAVNFYLDANSVSLNTSKIRISWVGSLLTDKAFLWHLAEVRHYDLDDPTAWTTYSEALQARFTDKGADAKNYQKMMRLTYEGDTHNYLTQFTELNTSGQALGLGERNTIRRVLPDKLTEMVNTWTKGKHLNDNQFIEQYKKAGQTYEESEANAAAAELPQLPRRRLPVKTDKEFKESPKSIVGKIWASLKEALAGIVQSAIDQRKADGLQCWRCGRDTHHTLSCFAKIDLEGRSLPAAPQRLPETTAAPSAPRVSALKRHLDESDSDPYRSDQENSSKICVQQEHPSPTPVYCDDSPVLSPCRPFYKDTESESDF
ncbi:hypothetical protein E4U12_000956 [Claviceps purpurea]|nr:hypothetical protein E4U12_000956 [Claviceps purpurea]